MKPLLLPLALAAALGVSACTPDTEAAPPPAPPPAVTPAPPVDLAKLIADEVRLARFRTCQRVPDLPRRCVPLPPMHPAADRALVRQRQATLEQSINRTCRTTAVLALHILGMVESGIPLATVLAVGQEERGPGDELTDAVIRIIYGAGPLTPAQVLAVSDQVCRAYYASVA